MEGQESKAFDRQIRAMLGVAEDVSLNANHLKGIILLKKSDHEQLLKDKTDLTAKVADVEQFSNATKQTLETANEEISRLKLDLQQVSQEKAQAENQLEDLQRANSELREELKDSQDKSPVFRLDKTYRAKDGSKYAFIPGGEFFTLRGNKISKNDAIDNPDIMEHLIEVKYSGIQVIK